MNAKTEHKGRPPSSRLYMLYILLRKGVSSEHVVLVYAAVQWHSVSSLLYSHLSLFLNITDNVVPALLSRRDNECSIYNFQNESASTVPQ
jgi:hypothetical protein